MELIHVYRKLIYFSPPGSVIGLPILSNHLASKLINHLYTWEWLDIMAEPKILSQAKYLGVVGQIIFKEHWTLILI